MHEKRKDKKKVYSVSSNSILVIISIALVVNAMQKQAKASQDLELAAY